MHQALKGCPKSCKSPNLVALSLSIKKINTKPIWLRWKLPQTTWLIRCEKRFGEILPLFQKSLANLWHYWANFHCCKWPNLKKINNHQVTLEIYRLLLDSWVMANLCNLISVSRYCNLSRNETGQNELRTKFVQLDGWEVKLWRRDWP